MENKKFCKHCRQEIHPQATVCPFCQHKQNNIIDNILGTIGSAALIIIAVPVLIAVFKGVKTGFDNASLNNERTVSVSDEVTTVTYTTAPKELEELYNEHNIKISLDDIYFEGNKASLKILIENNSSTNMHIQTRDSSINGFMCEATFAEEVAANKKAYAYIKYYDFDLEKANIKPEEIKDIEFKFHFFEDYFSDNTFDSENISIKVN